MPPKLIHYVQFIDPSLVPIEALDTRIPSSAAKFPLQELVLKGKLHDDYFTSVDRKSPVVAEKSKGNGGEMAGR